MPWRNVFFFFCQTGIRPGSLDETAGLELKNFKTTHGRGNLQFSPDSAADLHPRL